MKVLFVGGTGVISMDAALLAAARGMEVTVLTRGLSKMIPAGVRQLRADIRDRAQVEAALGDEVFDVLVECITYTPEDMRYKLDLLRGRFKQFIYISSVAAYQTDAPNPVVEGVTPVGNPNWNYGRGKAACEAELERDRLLHGTIYTVIRPSETYNDLRLPGTFVASPHRGGYTMIHRMRTGKPVLVHDDGKALNCFLHSVDMARAIVGLFLNEKAYGQCYHITSDEVHSWLEVTQMAAQAAGVTPDIVFVPWLELARELPSTPLGDTYGVLDKKRYSHIYDNSKIKAVVPEFRNTISLLEGLQRVVAYYDAHPELQQIDEAFSAEIDRVCNKYR